MKSNEVYEQMSRSLIERYGELISRRDLAKIVDTSPESLGNALRRNNDLKTQVLRANKRRFGRRVFYPAAMVAAVFTLDDGELRELLKGEDNGH
ncbi:MAG: hypothetical protein ACE5NW_18785 [Acidiferrobacterales bacterium]